MTGARNGGRACRLEPEELTRAVDSWRAVVIIGSNGHHPIEGLPVGSTHVVWCSVPDTGLNVPARLRVSGRTILGFVSNIDGFYTFTPRAAFSRQAQGSTQR